MDKTFDLHSPIENQILQDASNAPDYSYSSKTKYQIITSLACFTIMFVGVAGYAVIVTGQPSYTHPIRFAIGICITSIAIVSGLFGGIHKAKNASQNYANEIEARELALARNFTLQH